MYFSNQSSFHLLSNLFFFFRLPDLVEYIVEPLLAGLGDNSSYVRRSAVMGCVKLYHLIPDFVEGKRMKTSVWITPCLGLLHRHSLG